MPLPNWGVVATVKAPTRDILNFAAHHLDLGAHRVHVYLDADDRPARDALIAHPNCRVTLCTDVYWSRRWKKGRPDGHQFHQTLNATHCYNRRPEVDWLAHIDVDEFLWPEIPVAEQLATQPAAEICTRVRPIEALAPDPTSPPAPGQTWFKSCVRTPTRRREQTEQIYPAYGRHLNGGFMSHVVGKVFIRTGHENVSLRIHNAFVGGEKNTSPAELGQTALCHFHAADWDHWFSAYRYRLRHGSYREGLKPAPSSDGTGLNMHALMQKIEAEGGETALRRFFAEVCTATPRLRTALDDFGLLHEIALDLDSKRARHFPDFA